MCWIFRENKTESKSQFSENLGRFGKLSTGLVCYAKDPLIKLLMGYLVTFPP